MIGEARAWRLVEDIAKRLSVSSSNARANRDELRNLARNMLAQLERGEHANPALVIYGNPKGFVLSRRTVEIKYHHAEDGEDYVHVFRSPVVMTLTTEGGKRCIRLHGQHGQPLWGTADEIADGQFDGGKLRSH